VSLFAAAAMSTGASSTVLLAALAIMDATLLGLCLLLRWILRRLRPKVRTGAPTTIRRLPQAPSCTAASSTAVRSTAVRSTAAMTARSSGTAGLAITGVVGAGPDGPYTAPLSRETCAWYRLQSFRRKQGVTELYSNSVQWEKVSELTSEGDVVITDGTGSVRLSMTDVAHVGGWFARSTSAPRRPATGGKLAQAGTALLSGTGLRQDEYVMPVGAQVTVLGDLVVTSGRVRPAPGADRLVATPLSVTAWDAEQAAAGAGARRTALLVYGICGAMALLVNIGLLWAALRAGG
jgi:hypothetical protein